MNIKSTLTGNKIAATVSLSVKQLRYNHQPVFLADGRPVMDNDWVYVHMRNYGRNSINVNRANYCAMVYLMNTPLMLNKSKATPRLRKFIRTIASTRVFKHKGVAYQISLKYEGNKIDIASIERYWHTHYSGGREPWAIATKKYGSCQYTDFAVDIDKIFGL